MERLRTILAKLCNLVQLIVQGQWKTAFYRLQVRWYGLDLTTVDVAALGSTADRAKDYHDSGGPLLDQICRTLPIRPSDAVLDIGCGKGGAMITLAKHGFARVDGIEISDQLAEVARENLRRMRIGNSTVFRCDAALFTDFDPYTVLYMYNPFPRPVMQATLEAIDASCRRRPRTLTLIYVTPDDHDLVLAAGFRPVSEVDDPDHRTLVYVREAVAGVPAKPSAA